MWPSNGNGAGKADFDAGAKAWKSMPFLLVVRGGCLSKTPYPRQYCLTVGTVR